MAITQILLDAVAATGAGGAFSSAEMASAGSAHLGILNKYSVQITTTAASSAVTLSLEGSIDGSTWHIVASHTMTAGELTAKSAMFHVVDKGVTQVRANLTTFTRSASETLTVKAIAY